MKYLMAILGGFTVTLGAFAGGALFAVLYLRAEPVEVKSFRNMGISAVASDVRTVDLSLRPAAETHSETDTMPPLPAIDNRIHVASPARPEGLSEEHVAWCKARYRSYQPETNRYTGYSGESRECISPHRQEETAALVASFPVEQRAIDDAAGTLPIAHVQACFARYRSYRAEDNSYQPYGGGPRRQCTGG